MKKISIVLPLLILIMALYSCSDDTTSSKTRNVIISYEKAQKNDTLIINFKFQDTAYSFLDTAILTQFTDIPNVTYDVNIIEGYTDFILYDIYDSSIFIKRFSGKVGNKVPLSNIPYRYVFNAAGCTGYGSLIIAK